MADMRLAGCQHFAFHEYKDPRGNRLFAGHSNGSVPFQLAQVRVGEGKVPVSIVLYIDDTFLKKGIPIRPAYSKFVCIYIYIYHTQDHTWCHDWYHTWYNIFFIPAVSCLNNDRSVMSKSYASIGNITYP